MCRVSGFALQRLVARIVILAFIAGKVVHSGEAVFLQHMMNLQRFQALCRITNDAPPIRVLIYGQSITALPWSTRVVDQVRLQHPGRSWIVQNRCIQGDPSQDLVYTSEADVYPFNPDLIIFQAYGSEDAYRQLVESFRARTTSDILLINDHYAVWDNVTNSDIGDWDGRILPEIALGNGACLADIRTPWREYLLETGLPYTALLSDGIHPNAAGQVLMQSLVSKYVSGPALSPLPDPYNCGRVRRYSLPGAASAAGQWRFQFQGTRIVGRVGSGTAVVYVDGFPPSHWIGGGVHGRASPWPGDWWPCLMQIRTSAPLVPETWKLTIDATNGLKSFRFSVTGSVTGFDGSGSTDAPFRSNSGRVVISPKDWWWDYLFTQLAPGTVFTWSSIATGNDKVTRSPASSGQEWVDLVSNLQPGIHELVIQQPPGEPTVEEIIVYDPAGGGLGAPGTVYQLLGTNGCALLPNGKLQFSSNYQDWSNIPDVSPTWANTNYFPFSGAFMELFRVAP